MTEKDKVIVNLDTDDNISAKDLNANREHIRVHTPDDVSLEVTSDIKAKEEHKLVKSDVKEVVEYAPPSPIPEREFKNNLKREYVVSDQQVDNFTDDLKKSEDIYETEGSYGIHSSLSKKGKYKHEEEIEEQLATMIEVPVKGYTREDGTEVSSHTRLINTHRDKYTFDPKEVREERMRRESRRRAETMAKMGT